MWEDLGKNTPRKGHTKCKVLTVGRKRRCGGGWSRVSKERVEDEDRGLYGRYNTLRALSHLIHPAHLTGNAPSPRAHPLPKSHASQAEAALVCGLHCHLAYPWKFDLTTSNFGSVGRQGSSWLIMFSRHYPTWARSCGNVHSSPGQAPSLRLIPHWKEGTRVFSHPALGVEMSSIMWDR